MPVTMAQPGGRGPQLAGATALGERRGTSNATRYAASLTATACLTLTLLGTIGPALDPSIGSRRLHVGLEVAAGMVLIFIAAVLLGRLRLNRSRRTLLKFAAFVVLVLDNLFSGVFTIAMDSVATGGTSWAFAARGLVGGALLAVAAVLPDRPVERVDRAVLLVLTASMTVVAAISVAGSLLGDVLPNAFARVPEGADDFELLSEHPGLALAETLTAVCFGIAAVAFARIADEEGDVFLKWLAIGCVVGSAAFLNYALFPSEYTDLLATGDIFFLAAVAVLAYAAVREISREEAAMIRTAVLEERRRVARDLHDGVAQELAFIASQMQWYMRRPDDPAPLRQVMDATERALDESRGAIAALTRPMDDPIDKALGHAALDVASRVGARLELDLVPGLHVSGEWREALLRITREAVGNAVRHGGARAVVVSLRPGLDGGVTLRIVDDGEGFDTDAPRSRQSYGLTSMRERTESLGGRFAIESAPGAGTTVEVRLR